MSKEKQIEEMACETCQHYFACLVNAEYVPSPCKAYKRKQVEQEWISVDERLPEDGLSFEDFYPVDCLLAAKVGDRVVVDWGTRYMSFSYRTGKVESYWEILHDWDEGEGCEITHWMPLPEAPKMRGGK